MYNHQGTVTLETDRLILRRFQTHDAKEMFDTWTSDDEVSKYMRWETHKSVEETEKTISNWIDQYNRNDFYLWAITKKDTDSLIGTIGMFCENANDMCYDTAYCIGKPYWGRGYVSEALKKVLEFGLAIVGINRVEAYHSINNPASGMVMQKCGMKYEGRLRQKYKSKIGFEDCDLYAILKDDLDL